MPLTLAVLKQLGPRTIPSTCQVNELSANLTQSLDESEPIMCINLNPLHILTERSAQF